MTVIHKGNQEYYGLSSDTKPIAADTAVNATFDETDTGQLYTNNGTTWVPKSIASAIPADLIVTLEGSTAYCRDAGGNILSSSTVLETPIRYAITNGLRKKIYVSAGTYNLSSGFTEFVIDVNQAEMLIEFSPGALISVPNGYAGNLFSHVEGASQAKLVGGRFNEQGAQQRLWNCYHYESGSEDGVNTCTARDSYVRNCASAIKLVTTGVTGATPVGWVNNCNFRDIFIDRSVVGIEFNMGATSFGMNRNVFTNVLIQSYPGITTYGVKNLAGDGGEFYKVHVYDIDASGKYSTITPTAFDTQIIGGRMTSTNAAQYTDNGVRTVVRDKWLKTWGRRGILSDTGTGAKLTFSTPHGLDRIPTYWNGTAANSATRVIPFHVTADFTYVYFVLQTAPANGVAVSWSWEVSG